ncbi:MAG: hypothetical protein DHS20C10_07170 [marine bacterium B5-7]|nr:MAG: hypothetical protein DHS20C10_07170 [marine bacterium B5-7]
MEHDTSFLSGILSHLTLDSEHPNKPIHISLPHILPEQYATFVEETLETGFLPKTILDATMKEEASSHDACEIKTRAREKSEDHLTLSMAYQADTACVDLTLDPSFDTLGNFSDKVKYLKISIESYYLDRYDDNPITLSVVYESDRKRPQRSKPEKLPQHDAGPSTGSDNDHETSATPRLSP